MAEPSAEIQAQTRHARAALIDAGFRPARHSGPVRLLRRFIWPFVRPYHFHTLDQVAAADASIARLEGEVRRLAGLTMDAAKLHAAEARLDRAEARADAAAGDIDRLHREQEVDRLDRMEKRLDGLEIMGDGHRRRVEHIQNSRNDDVARMVTLYMRLRSDLLAIGNRHVWVEEQTAAALQTVEERSAAALQTVEARSAAALQTVEERSAAALQAVGQVRDDVVLKLGRMAADGTEQAARVSEMHDQMRLLWEGLFLTATPDGVFLLKAGELISETARRDGTWDPHILRVAAQASDVVHGRRHSPAMLLGIDVGAHFGLISIAIAKLFDKVISFEPNSFNATLLRANVALNGLDGKVDVRREALASSEGSVSLAPNDRQEIALPLDDQDRIAPGTASNLGAYSFVADGTGISRARAIPLDKLRLDDVAFIKIDAQGADGAVLLGAMETIARCRPWLVFEWEQKLAQAFAVSFEEVETRFADIGYRVTVLHRHNAKQIDYLAVPQEEADAAPEAALG